MADLVSYSMGLNITGGPTLVGSAVFEAEAEDYVDEVTILKNSVVKTINLQPSLLTELKALMITSSNYSGEVSFTVDEVATEFVLKAPMILIGPDQIELLGATLNELKFTNANATTNATVSILVARTATEPGGS
jgi:hypothetical protein